MTAFEANQHDSLVLGAFGCGVFKNDPFTVAKIFRQHLESTEFKNSFKKIIFAISNAKMYHIFKQVFNDANFTDIQQTFMEVSLNDEIEEERLYSNNWNQGWKETAKQRRNFKTNHRRVNNRKK